MTDLKRVAIIEIATGTVIGAGMIGGELPPHCHQPAQPPAGFLWIEHASAAEGWRYVDGAFIAPPEPEPQGAPK